MTMPQVDAENPERRGFAPTFDSGSSVPSHEAKEGTMPAQAEMDSSTLAASAFPEGGMQAWLTVIGGCAALLIYVPILKPDNLKVHGDILHFWCCAVVRRLPGRVYG